MRFTKIELENVFAYDEKVEFDFPPPEPRRNIALIWGRNGMGKTSFLRALKLLFLGVEPPEMRTVGFPPKPLGQRQYVVGDGANWSGLINRQAMRRAAADGTSATAKVAATWTMEDGSSITVERHWTATLSGYEEHAVVFDGKEKLAGVAATERIGDLLPPEFIPFFFFDGEDIKSLAETDERKPIEFDRLLRITFINDLAGELGKVVADRQRRNMGQELLERYVAEEAALVKARGARDVALQGLEDIEERLSDDSAQLRRLQQRRDALASGASAAQREALDKRRGELRTLMDEQQARIADSIPATAPVLANLGLVRAALGAVEERLDASSRAERDFLGRISPLLPGWITGAPVGIDNDKAAVLAAELSGRMEGELPSGAATGLFASLEPMRAERLRAMLTRWAVAGPDALAAQAAEIDAMRRYQREFDEINEAIIQIEVGSQANIEQYRQTVRDIARIEERTAEDNQRKGQLEARAEDAIGRLAQHEAQLQLLAASQDRATRDRDDARFMSKVIKALNDLREDLRREVRIKLEERINVRFHELVTDHGLVDRIEIDDQYTMTFLDGQKRPVGRTSLSAGLKQLAATALLWAMKDVSRVDMPVVIDTPLGRIDRENQDNMLINYYPRLAGQVIILPTNTEIDRRRFDLIKDHVGIQYTIANETGDRARPESGMRLAL